MSVGTTSHGRHLDFCHSVLRRVSGLTADFDMHVSPRTAACFLYVSIAWHSSSLSRIMPELDMCFLALQAPLIWVPMVRWPYTQKDSQVCALVLSLRLCRHAIRLARVLEGLQHYSAPGAPLDLLSNRMQANPLPALKIID